MALFVIDFKDFMCMTCLDSFLAFCQSVPSPLLEQKAWGILVLAGENGTPDKNNTVRIAEKKLRGFMTANRIKFPVVIDQNRVFQSFATEGTALVMMDADTEKIVRYNFPLKRTDSIKIRAILLEN